MKALPPCDARSCITATAEEWLDKFFLHCVGCRVDFMTAHICAHAAVKLSLLRIQANRPHDCTLNMPQS